MGDQINPNDLAYDLRQIYAKLVGEHLQDITDARKSDNFYSWYKALEDLHTITRHKFKKGDKDEEEYKKLKEALIKLANDYSACFLGKNKDPKQRAELETALRNIEEFLYAKMNDAKMFGEGGRIAGL